MKNIHFIYFDVGGVIVKVGSALEALQEKTDKTLPEIQQALEKHASLGGKEEHLILENFKKELGLDFSGTYKDFVELFTGAFTPIEETHALIKELARTHSVGILSNTEPGVLENSIKLGNLPDVAYKTIVASCYEGVRKPSEAIYAIAEKKADTAPANILFIDDIEKNIEAAKARGWNGVVFDTKNPANSIKKIKELLN